MPFSGILTRFSDSCETLLFLIYKLSLATMAKKGGLNLLRVLFLTGILTRFSDSCETLLFLIYKLSPEKRGG